MHTQRVCHRYGLKMTLLLAAASCGVAGCAAATPFAGDAAGMAVDKSVEIGRIGKVNTFQPVPYPTVIAAVRQAGKELDLELIGEETFADKMEITFEDSRKQKIVVTMIRRSGQVTHIRTDVGLFGASGMSKVLMRQIVHDLPAANDPDLKDTGKITAKPGLSDIE